VDRCKEKGEKGEGERRGKLCRGCWGMDAPATLKGISTAERLLIHKLFSVSGMCLDLG